MFSQLVDASTSIQFSQSQSEPPPMPMPFSPSLSLWLRSGVDHADTGTGSQTTDHGLPRHSTRPRKRYTCGKCDEKIFTSWGIAYHRLCICDGGNTSENLDIRSSSSSSLSLSSKGSGGRWPAIRCNLLALVRNQSVPRVDTQSEEHAAV